MNQHRLEPTGSTFSGSNSKKTLPPHSYRTWHPAAMQVILMTALFVGLLALIECALPTFFMASFVLASQTLLSQATLSTYEMRSLRVLGEGNLFALCALAAIDAGRHGSFPMNRWDTQTYAVACSLLSAATLKFRSFNYPCWRVGATPDRLWGRAKSGTLAIVPTVVVAWALGAFLRIADVSGAKPPNGVDPSIAVLGFIAGFGIGSVATDQLSRERRHDGVLLFGPTLVGLCALWLAMPPSTISTMTHNTIPGVAAGITFVPRKRLRRSRDPEVRDWTFAARNLVTMCGCVIILWSYPSPLKQLVSQSIDYVRFALFLLTTTVLFLFWLMPAGLLSLFMRCLMRILFRIRITGLQHIPTNGSALIVANHVSYADAILIGCATKRTIRFLMAKELFDRPFIKPFCRMLGTIPIDRAISKSAWRALQSARVQLKRGNLVGLFPEGRMTLTSHIQPFKRGVLAINEGLNVPVVPICLCGLGGHVLSKTGSLYSRIWPIRRTVSIRIGHPLTDDVTMDCLHDTIIQLANRESADRRRTLSE
jgi:1-acyl-sn-glycerol-3-phosphate acyltransferase